MKTIEFQMPRVRERGSTAWASAESATPLARAPRLARLLALAHKLDGLVRSGAVRNYGELARVGGVSQSRLSQILIFVNLAPAIQERVLFLTAAEAQSLCESDLRAIARESTWTRQQERFDSLRQKCH